MDTSKLKSKLGILKLIEFLCSIIAFSLLIIHSGRTELQECAVALYAIVFLVSLSLLIVYVLRGFGKTKTLVIASTAVHGVLGFIILIISAILLGKASEYDRLWRVRGSTHVVLIRVSRYYISALAFGILTSLVLMVDSFFIWKQGKGE